MFVEMGEVVNVAGLRGELKLLVTGNFDEAVLTSPYLRRRDAAGRMHQAECLGLRWKGQTALIRLAGIVDRDAAESAIGESVGFESADYDRPDFPRGDRPAPFVYLGLRVVTTTGREVGEVDDVLILPANWVLSVRAPGEDGGEKEILVPVVDAVIREVDRDGGRVVIEAMPGLLDED